MLLRLFAASPASAADRFVSTAGVDTQAASGDTIKIAQGTYVTNFTITGNTTLGLSGGCTPDFASQGPPSKTRPLVATCDVGADEFVP